MFKFVEYFKNINKKTDEINSLLQNPFFDSNSELNPFKDAFSQVYIWVEKDD